MYINGNIAKCKDCKYFSFRYVAPYEQLDRYTPMDGWCSRIVPRGHIGAGKEGGKVYSGQMHCFDFELRADVESKDAVERELKMKKNSIYGLEVCDDQTETNE